MTLLVTIITNGLSRIFLKPLASTSTFTKVALQRVVCINREDQSGILRPFFFVESFPFLLLFLLLLSLLRGLSTIGALRSWSILFLGPGHRFFNPWLFHWLALGTGFSSCQPTTLEAVVIGVTNIETRPESGFGFGVDSFFDYFFNIIELSVALLHFNLYQRPEAFLEISNHCTFFWSTIQVKFNWDGL